MKILRQFGAIAILLFFSVAPVMACMAPGAEMTAPERACCRAMKNQCGRMRMPASQDCCQGTGQSVSHNLLQAKAISLHPVTFAFAGLASAAVGASAPIAGGSFVNSEHSPPESPSSRASILRI